MDSPANDTVVGAFSTVGDAGSGVGGMKVKLRNPDRVEVLDGPSKVRDILARLGVHPDSVIVIRGDELLTRDDTVGADDEIEVRPVVSGG